MSTEEKVDEIIDKLIDEALAKSEKDNEDIKKKKPEPFRYLKNREEIKAELSQQTSVSIMKNSTSTKIFEDKLAILGLGDIDTIENVIRKHEASRKIR
jgi:hypothetical protein